MKETKQQNLALPIHPRKQQQIFLELLQVQANKTPHLTNDTPLQRRLETFQSMYLRSLQELKKGSDVLYHPSFSSATSEIKEDMKHTEVDLFLQLSADGKRVMGSKSHEDESTDRAFIEFQVQDIAHIKLSDPSASQVYFHVVIESQTKFTFSTSCKTSSQHWVIGLICGSTAMDPRKAKDLIWQAARLRMCELALQLEFIEAVKIVQEALERMAQGDEYPSANVILNHLLIQCTE